MDFFLRERLKAEKDKDNKIKLARQAHCQFFLLPVPPRLAGRTLWPFRDAYFREDITSRLSLTRAVKRDSYNPLNFVNRPQIKLFGHIIKLYLNDWARLVR